MKFSKCEEKLLSFLYFGYCPHLSKDVTQRSWSQVTTNKEYQNLHEDDLLSIGADLFEQIFSENDTKVHIVPLSGGYDSRAILGALLKKYPHEKIITATFGTPGTFDYDIGRYISDKYNIKNKRFDLSKISITQKELEATAKECQEPIWLFDAFFNRLICHYFGDDKTYWSGFMGDPIAGSHIKEDISVDWTQALDKFIQKERFSKSINLIPSDFQLKKLFPKSPILRSEILTYDEQVDFLFRQETLINTIVIPNQDNYKTPFLNSSWVEFMINIPINFRKDQYLYKKILHNLYPELLSIPVKSKKGLSVPIATFSPYDGWCDKPMINYIDFEEGLRKRNDLKTVVYENLQDLKSRKLFDWINIDSIWNNHQNNNGNHAMALTLLASLEIIIKTRKIN